MFYSLVCTKMADLEDGALRDHPPKKLEAKGAVKALW